MYYATKLIPTQWGLFAIFVQSVEDIEIIVKNVQGAEIVTVATDAGAKIVIKDAIEINLTAKVLKILQHTPTLFLQADTGDDCLTKNVLECGLSVAGLRAALKECELRTAIRK